MEITFAHAAAMPSNMACHCSWRGAIPIWDLVNSIYFTRRKVAYLNTLNSSDDVPVHVTMAEQNAYTGAVDQEVRAYIYSLASAVCSWQSLG